MLPYQENTKKLENLLEKLFVDDESNSEDIEVLGLSRPIRPRSSCCTYNYGSF